MSGMLNSTIARKVAMALSAIFLLIFLLQHFIINFTSVISENTFNELSHFMGTNILIQFVMQPILIFAVVFHFVMGFILEIKNKKARNIKYASFKGSTNTTWVSRNMIYSGLVILAFLVLHFIDFWLPELNYKYIQFNPEDPTRYYHELVEKFHNPIRVGAYVVAFVLLALHLLHGFQSAFQSVGLNNKFTPALKTFGKYFAIIIPLGFIFIALFHHFNH
ncbi:succinate dehydrogenase cytochrome b subunit [Galbibacter pacificus]|uniref:Succinate dehydrogenase cytochrome b subunit n=1 Tax=Galbibacter pacificus TaxID=2996052 RepID=A0ABT6FU21_9FLAO|nr:succinate dehydrogenase cytochrome b subunit [Galbibacter pacificus]MDG3583293.1 succinate dehydrogenase cytochrome b subunit [Galbibacter pacificus]MDG3586774.1 succinate dehydrogenase cytochrome b subunit [Galbibacter pacificus]